MPAGDETGVYHIVVGGLPWQCRWQDLKDFSRGASGEESIVIDHAHVYPNTTDGWVRVRGKSNFHRAMGKNSPTMSHIANGPQRY